MKNQFGLFTNIIGEVLALLCAFVFFFGYPNPAFATEIDTIRQESDAIENNFTEDNSADSYICGDNIVVDGDGNTIIIQKGNDDNPSIDVVSQPVNDNTLGNLLKYFLITIGGVSSSIFAYKNYQRLAAGKTNKELEERIENLETIVTKDKG